MKLRRWTRTPALVLVAMGSVPLLACGGEGDGGGPPPAADAPAAEAPAASQPPAGGEAGGGDIARGDFVLCPAIEPIGEELATIAGFRMDPARGVEAVANECFVRGDGFVSVALAPAFAPSVAMHASGYDGVQTPVPDLGSDALVIDAPQPHVVFRLRGQIIDVGVEGGSASTASAIALANRVREALLAANGG